MLSRRTQVLLDQDQYARLEQRARETDRSVGAVIREAIDTALPAARWPTRHEAAEYFRTAPRMPGSQRPEDIRADILSMYDHPDA
jgi:hypothetical protein